MALNFPANPTNNQEFTANSITFVYNSARSSWNKRSNQVGLNQSEVDARIAAEVDTAFVDALDVDADTLDGQEGSYYLNYNNLSNRPTIPSAYSDENVDDRVNSLLTAGSNITLTYDDGANTLTIASTASGGGGVDWGFERVAVTTTSDLQFRAPGNFGLPAEDQFPRVQGNTYEYSYYAAHGKQFTIIPTSGSGDYVVRLVDLGGIRNDARDDEINGTTFMIVNRANSSRRVTFAGSGLAVITPAGAVIEPGYAALVTLNTLGSGTSLSPKYEMVVAAFFPNPSDSTLGSTQLEQVDDRVNTLIVAGTGITKTYNDSANTLTIASTAAGGSDHYDDGDSLTFGNTSSSPDARFFYDGTNNTFEMELESAVDSFIITDNGTTRYRFEKDGDLTIARDITAFGSSTALSDERFKTNIKTLTDSSEKILKLRGVEFDRVDIDEHQIGLIAQEVEDVIPEVVKTSKDGIKSISYGNLVGLLIEAVKTQEVRIRELERWQHKR